MNHEYLTASEIIAKFGGVSASCLRNWSNQGKVRVQRTTGGKRSYHVEDVRKRLGRSTDPVSDRKTVGYARVSSAHQKSDLERQKEYLKENYSINSIYSDVGSGLNYNRRAFNALLRD